MDPLGCLENMNSSPQALIFLNSEDSSPHRNFQLQKPQLSLKLNENGKTLCTHLLKYLEVILA